MADIEGGQAKHEHPTKLEIREAKLDLYKAAMSGDWITAKGIFDKYSEEIKRSHRITKEGETALHIATAAGHPHFVEELVKSMSKEELAIQTYPRESKSQTPTQNTGQARRVSESDQTPTEATTKEGNTKSFCAAVSGNLEIAQEFQTCPRVPNSQTPTQVPEQERRVPKSDQTPTENGNTAFFYAAVSGNVKIAELMIKEDSDLAATRGRENFLPIHMAAVFGHRQMVRYLYGLPNHCLFKDDYNEEQFQKDGVNLLVALIRSEIYDVALDMVQENKRLATKRDSRGYIALHAFALKPHISSNPIWNIFGKNKQGQGLQLVDLLWRQVILEEDEKISQLIKPEEPQILEDGKTISRPIKKSEERLIFMAAKQGNYDLLTTMIRSYPDLVFKVDHNKYTIFHIAVLHRHVNIFNLMHMIGSTKNFIIWKQDPERNNILHLVGNLPSLSRLQVVPGAALQLQRELLWFEEVKKIVGPDQVEAKNKEDKTPRELFVEKHEELRKAGEEWMRNTANSCMVVSTLIATVAFAAAFTVPGGNGEDTGIPIFLDNIWFQIFTVADAISLIISASSIFFFLSILTSRYSVDDFFKKLPMKVMFGLLFLFIAVVAMMVAFTATFFIIFKHQKLQFAHVIALIAFLPIVLFVCLYLEVFCRFFHSTFISFLPFWRSKKTSFFYV